MDTGKKMDLEQLLPQESETPWIEGQMEAMPEEMRERIFNGVEAKIKAKGYSQSNLQIIIRALSAACIILALLFSFEQFNTIHKIKLLEQKMADQGGSFVPSHLSQNDLLIINRFVSWSEVKSLRFQTDKHILEEELLPSYLQPNLFGDKKLKEQFARYVREIQLATKIYLQ